MKLPDAFEQLEGMLLEKNYNELSGQEQQWLSAQGIDMEVYRRQRELLKTARATFAVPLAAPMPSAALRLALADRRARGYTYGKLKWAMAAAVMIGCFLLGRWASVPAPPTPEVIVQEVTIRDTVYLERTVEIQLPPEVRWRERVERDTIYVSLPVASASILESTPTDGSVLPVTAPEARQDWSRNAEATEQLLKVLVEVY